MAIEITKVDGCTCPWCGANDVRQVPPAVQEPPAMDATPAATTTAATTTTGATPTPVVPVGANIVDAIWFDDPFLA